MAHIKYFKIFSPLNKVSKAPVDNNFVPVCMCFEVKFGLRKKSQLAAVGNMMD